MMTNLFSVFDPSTSIKTSLNWLSSSIFLIFMTTPMWLNTNRISLISKTIISSIANEFKTLLTNPKIKSTQFLFTSTLILIMMNNFLGLFPYIFTSTSHLSMSLALSLPLWISFMLHGWIINTTYMFAHLIPQGTPPALMPFMVLIETISNVIRPGTLAVRLSANMIAGHLLMTLLGNQTATAHSFILIALIGTQIILLTLESAVALIQSYVFAVLSTLYSSEITH
uniref:ATP synthase subunit a n=1 Tax=Neelides sp. FZ-2019 TaxID=2583951 RepID=A0A6H0EWM3_9HEXA|nr:ATP synthase F0 subunit 6 [Neelides sp. FZ-2019]